MNRDKLRALMADLINDYRGSAGEYQAWCLSCILALYKARHSVRLDRYGWPMLPEFKR